MGSQRLRFDRADFTILVSEGIISITCPHKIRPSTEIMCHAYFKMEETIAYKFHVVHRSYNSTNGSEAHLIDLQPRRTFTELEIKFFPTQGE